MSVDPPRLSPPSLKALRAFEAAARHESFTKAAIELHVTAAAVAQQVRMLEEWVGQPLFQRLPQGLLLTREARHVLPRISGAFDELGCAIHALRTINRPNEVRVAALPAIAILWLSPRLNRLHQQFPDLTLSVSALEQPPNFRRDLYDLALFFVKDKVEGAKAITLAEDTLFPVCAPTYKARTPLDKPSDIAGKTLLHDSVWQDDWLKWLDYATVEDVDASGGMTFSLYNLALQAAIDGSGILMGHEPLVRHAVHDGRLTVPFDIYMPSPATMSLLVPEESETDQKILDLASWFQEELASEPPLFGSRDII